MGDSAQLGADTTRSTTKGPPSESESASETQLGFRPALLGQMTLTLPWTCLSTNTVPTPMWYCRNSPRLFHGCAHSTPLSYPRAPVRSGRWGAMPDLAGHRAHHCSFFLSHSTHWDPTTPHGTIRCDGEQPPVIGKSLGPFAQRLNRVPQKK